MPASSRVVRDKAEFVGKVQRIRQPGAGIRRQRVRLLERSEDHFIDTLRQRSYLVMIFSSLSRLAVMDSSTEFFPLIHAPPSRNKDWRISSVTVP